MLTNIINGAFLQGVSSMFNYLLAVHPLFCNTPQRLATVTMVDNEGLERVRASLNLVTQDQQIDTPSGRTQGNPEDKKIEKPCCLVGQEPGASRSGGRNWSCNTKADQRYHANNHHYRLRKEPLYNYSNRDPNEDWRS